MPRNSSGTYSKPAGTAASPNTTITSSQFNATIDDIAADLNAARPVSAGGTGAATVPQARTNLQVAQAQANVTDTTAGRGLIVGAFGVGGNAPSITATDLNGVVTGRDWGVNSPSGVSNRPATIPGVLTVQRRADNRVFQTYRTAPIATDNTSARVYERSWDGTTWSDWWQVLSVISGTDGGLNWVKYSDGRMEAWGSITDVTAVSSAVSAGFVSSNITLTYPAAIVWAAEPDLTITVKSPAFVGLAIVTESTTSVVYNYTSPTSLSSGNRRITFRADGRWR